MLPVGIVSRQQHSVSQITTRQRQTLTLHYLKITLTILTEHFRGFTQT